MHDQPLVSAVKRVSIFCRDRDKSLAFYRDILGMSSRICLPDRRRPDTAAAASIG
jgi:hypothetical protein